MTTGDWELFEDWCMAAGLSALPTTWATVQNFLVDVPCASTTRVRRLGTIRARHVAARAQLTDAPLAKPPARPWHTPGERVNVSLEDGPCWWDLGEALHHLPVHGYPHGVIARRDAVVLVAAARGWGRRRIVELTPGQLRTEPVPAIDHIDVPMTNHGLTCPSCAITRWLRVLAARYDSSGVAGDSVALVVDDHPIDVRVHDCGNPVPDGWQLAPYVLPSIDRYGNIEHGTRIPVRRVTSITASRQQPAEADLIVPLGASPHYASRPARPAPTPAERLPQIRAIDDVLERLEAAMADAENRWGEILGRLEE